MTTAFGIWSIAAIIFLLIGVHVRRSKEEVGFFTFSKPPKVKNVKAYNQAVGKLWFVFAAILEMLGIPFLFAEQNSPIFILPILGVLVLVIGIMISYVRIERKYRDNL